MRYASNQSMNTANRQRALAWLALVALALLQVANVVHQSGHAAADLAETCVACVQLDSPALTAFAVAASAPDLGLQLNRRKLADPPALQTSRTRPPPRAPPLS